MWRKRAPDPTPPVHVPDDIGEARAMREAATDKIHELRRQAPLVRLLTDTLIDRQGKNHYIETLYQHVKGAQ